MHFAAKACHIVRVKIFACMRQEDVGAAQRDEVKKQRQKRRADSACLGESGGGQPATCATTRPHDSYVCLDDTTIAW